MTKMRPGCGKNLNAADFYAKQQPLI